MPFPAITQDVPFSHSPIADSKVAVHLPATFKTADPFALCVFLHGRDVGVPIEKHIAAAIGQIKSSSTNTLLIAPRCGNDATDGRFRDTAEFSAELGTVLPPVLTQAGMAHADADRNAQPDRRR